MTTSFSSSSFGFLAVPTADADVGTVRDQPVDIAVPQTGLVECRPCGLSSTPTASF